MNTWTACAGPHHEQCHEKSDMLVTAHFHQGKIYWDCAHGVTKTTTCDENNKNCSKHCNSDHFWDPLMLLVTKAVKRVIVYFPAVECGDNCKWTSAHIVATMNFHKHATVTVALLVFFYVMHCCDVVVGWWFNRY
jgi:hypothetical protein